LLANPTGKRPIGRPTPRWSDYISDLAWTHFGVESAELLEIAVDREVASPPMSVAPETLPRGKWREHE